MTIFAYPASQRLLRNLTNLEDDDLHLKNITLVFSFHKPRAAGSESSSWRGQIHAPFGNQPIICVQLRSDSFKDSMASKPGVWSDWPWQSLGAWKVQPFVELDFIELNIYCPCSSSSSSSSSCF